MKKSTKKSTTSNINSMIYQAFCNNIGVPSSYKTLAVLGGIVKLDTEPL